MNKNTIIFAVVIALAVAINSSSVNAQTSNQKNAAETPAIQRLYFDHRGWVGTIDGDRVVINDRSYTVLSAVTVMSIDQKATSGVNSLKSGDYIGFTVDDERRIDAIYLLNPPKQSERKKP